MHRLFAFFAALILTIVTMASSGLASSADNIRFTLQPAKGADLQLQLRSGSDRGNSSTGSSFAAGELAGLDVAAFRAAGNHPIRFALIREAGRVDCAGTGGSSDARGTCAFVANPAFAQFLESRGVGRATREQSFHLTMVGASRALVEAIRAARYPTPDVETLVELAAVDVTPAYIAQLARRGFKPVSLDHLVQFGALDITPAYIDAMARSGYPKLAADDIVEFKAVGVSPEFIAGFERLGYRGLPADTLVELRALDVTPEYVMSLRSAGIALPSAQQLVKLGAVGFVPENRR